MNKSEFLLQAKGLIKTKEVATPIGTLTVRGMSAGARDNFEQTIAFANAKGELPKNIRAIIAVACVLDEAGKPMFTEKDIVDLAELPTDVLDPILNAALELSALTPEAIEAAKKK